MGGSSPSENTTKSVQVRFAPYIETRHESCLDAVTSIRNQIINDSPYVGVTELGLDDAIFAYGQTLKDITPMYQVFGKYLASIDVSMQFQDAFTSVVGKGQFNELISAESIRYDIDILIDKVTAYKVYMRSINAVASSSFALGLSEIEIEKAREISKISSELQGQQIPSIEIKFTAALDYFQENAKLYAKNLQLIFVLEGLTRAFNDTERFKNSLWPFSVLQFEATVIGALRGKASYQKTLEKRSRSGLSTVLSITSYTVQGAVIGSYFGPYGTVIGAVIGAIVGVAMRLLEG